MATLVDFQLRHYGPELINPFNAEKVQVASIDLTLGTGFRLYTADDDGGVIDLHDIHDYTVPVEIDPERGFILDTHAFVLAHTVEVVNVPTNMVARLEGKSSLSRFGLIIHATGGFVDPGWEGQLTLEMSNVGRLPIKMYPGDDICQIAYEFTAAPAAGGYNGRYQGARGAEASRYGLTKDEAQIRAELTGQA